MTGLFFLCSFIKVGLNWENGRRFFLGGSEKKKNIWAGFKNGNPTLVMFHYKEFLNYSGVALVVYINMKPKPKKSL